MWKFTTVELTHYLNIQVVRKLQLFDRQFKAAALKIYIVAPFVYPHLVECVHFDIQSTGQKSQCVNTVSNHSAPVQDLGVQDVLPQNVSVQDVQVRDFLNNKGLLLKKINIGLGCGWTILEEVVCSIHGANLRSDMDRGGHGILESLIRSW